MTIHGHSIHLGWLVLGLIEIIIECIISDNPAPRCIRSGTSVADTWGCCSSSNPCGADEGDCDNDNDCSGNLICGVNNCVGSQFHPAADCCIEQGNEKYVENKA